MKGRPIIFGEVLFDRFPDGTSVLGGAPFNVAWHLHGFGARPFFISRVGDDEAGTYVRRSMVEWGMDSTGLQIDPENPTGVVQVALEAGQPTFEILSEQAYDYIDVDGAVRTLIETDPALIYHGSLIMRNPVSRAALDALYSRIASPAFVDINLRNPWWREADLSLVLRRARWLKVNEDEFQRITTHLGQSVDSWEEAARELQRRYGMELLVVTRGDEGAVAFGRPKRMYSVRPRGSVRIVDTVGAGDAFASVLILGLLRDWSVEETLQRAQGFASHICGIRGATRADPSLYRNVMREWEGSA